MPKSLLAVLAHPDDETFAIGGTIAHYRTEGAHIALVCLTDGESGRSSGEDLPGCEELARTRRRELLCAAAILGVDCVEPLGLPDGDVEHSDQRALIDSIVSAIRRHRPQVVVTFGTEGGPTQHPDHKACSRAATAAYFQTAAKMHTPETGAAHYPARLYYLTWPATKASKIAATFDVCGVPITAQVAIGEYHDIKRAAFREHETQRRHAQLFESHLEENECFGLAAGTPQDEETVTDLFAGLDV